MKSTIMLCAFYESATTLNIIKMFIFIALDIQSVNFMNINVIKVKWTQRKE